MSEQRHEHDDPKQQLIALLQMDFTPPEKQAQAQDPEGNALASFLANVRSVESIEARSESQENVQLGQAVEELLAPAPITSSFKDFIASRVRHAHAWQDHADEAIAPDRLGLTSDDGIFDPAHAKDIEGQSIRGRIFDVIQRYTEKIPSDDPSVVASLELKPGQRPRDLAEAIVQLHTWASDYELTYGENPFVGIETEAFIAAAQRTVVVDEDELGFGQIIRRLSELGENDEQW